jgi:poly(A) polymerase
VARPGSNLGSSRDAALAVVRTLVGGGHVAYFAGGCVRDELLGLTPEDYDVATDATPDRVRSLFPRSQEVGAAFGVMLVRASTPSGRVFTIEVATFRSDGTYTDRRRPDQVHFSDPVADANRRDFTINAMFLDPLAGEAGAPLRSPPHPSPPSPPVPPPGLIDHVGGLADLRVGVIRAVGDPEKRLAEDHLRALRAVRFASRFGFRVDPGTADAIRRHASDLLGVSRERIGDEVRRLMASPSRAAAARLLDELALDAPTLAEPPGDGAGAKSGVEAGGSGPAAGYPLLSGLTEAPPPPLHTCLAAWALDRPAPPSPAPLLLHLHPEAISDVVARWRTALCLSNEERDGFSCVLSTLAALLAGWENTTTASQKRLAGGPCFSEALRLLRAVDPGRATFAMALHARLAATPSGICPTPLLSGDDLIAMGLPPGPAFRRLLDSVYDAQLEDRVSNNEEARELARRLGV